MAIASFQSLSENDFTSQGIEPISLTVAALVEVPLSPIIMLSEDSAAWNGFESLFFQASQSLVSMADNFLSICAFVMAGFGFAAGEGDAVACG